MLRLRAIVAWVDHAEAGHCPLRTAHDAIGDLHRACETYLYPKAA